MRIIRLIINWTILLTTPFWIIPFLVYGILFNKTEFDEICFIKGKIFIWE